MCPPSPVNTRGPVGRGLSDRCRTPTAFLLGWDQQRYREERLWDETLAVQTPCYKPHAQRAGRPPHHFISQPGQTCFQEPHISLPRRDAFPLPGPPPEQPHHRTHAHPRSLFLSPSPSGGTAQSTQHPACTLRPVGSTEPPGTIPRGLRALGQHRQPKARLGGSPSMMGRLGGRRPSETRVAMALGSSTRLRQACFVRLGAEPVTSRKDEA